ncbi:DUF3598 family protein [Romeria aff. gracilis LEGE 07310]|uniref:DUF3598 family protein n=1 Tax=Vasconcelosia minhoensis LEGE 07310 TaxID=915328 RepID=A0A8J7DDT9_9CYAN|nr:DUF3598 family protein [Romeria gracilis]MBE9079148.1 DUF3598 family protein [Romeria aff. gracilis LEGE 07310]
MTSQWQRLLKNTGTWQGSFTRLSPQGQVLTDTPSEVLLEPYDDNQAMRQIVCRWPAAQPVQEQTLDYRSVSRATLFCENGAFSYGSMQWSPFSEFGAELGLIDRDRRLRLVQLFEKGQQLQSITLIREVLKGTDPPEIPPLQLEELLGTWQGEAVTVYPDLSPDSSQATMLTIERVSDREIQQTLEFDSGAPIRSVGQVEGNRIRFEVGSQPIQVLLLSYGASSTCPTQIQPRQPLFLEAGWRLEPGRRQRLIRRYDASGAWSSLTLVTEQKV